MSDITAHAQAMHNKDGVSAKQAPPISMDMTPKYHGYLETKEDALTLLEVVLRGSLPQSPQEPRGTGPNIRSGDIFVWVLDLDVAAIKHTSDTFSWTSVDKDGDFFVECDERSTNALWRKTISISVQGYTCHFLSYYNPWDTVKGMLKTPSQDSELRTISLRPDLASHRARRSTFTRHCRLLRVNLTLKPP